MIQVIRKYSLILILIFIFTNIYNLEAKILYDKSGIIITDLDLKNYIDLSLQSDNILLEKNKAIKKLVLQKKIINDLKNNNIQYLARIDQQILMEFGQDNFNNIFIRDFIRFKKIKDEFIFEYYNNSLDFIKFKNIVESLSELKLPISNNNCLTILDFIDLRNNASFQENYFNNLKNKTSDYTALINDQLFQVCVNNKIIQYIDKSIVEYIETQIQDSFNELIYGKNIN
jgi:Fe-S cluster assembly iron-binding protein IscA